MGKSPPKDYHPLGADLGGEVVFGNRGELIFKPGKLWHTFWNAGDEPARIFEIISPTGFERYVEELANWERPLNPESVFVLTRYRSLMPILDLSQNRFQI